MAQKENSLPVQIKIENGMIEGIYDPVTGLRMFFGIPYARPPLGDLRWKAPQAADNWERILEVKKFGPRPVQINFYGDMIYRSDTVSEDCLYLNVWTPAKHYKKGLPVLVYFYVGGFVAGDGSEPRYDGASMAMKGMVVVTVNYRLNIFGFFAHPELSAEAPYKASGNYGLLDQNVSLQWVQKNIAAFGGDPKKVTIDGESAGSISVSAHMASPLSKDLIAGAIGESGACINPALHPVPLTEAEKTGLEFAEKAGYTAVGQLRKLSAQELFEIYNVPEPLKFPRVIDGYFFPKTLPEIFNMKEQSQIPLLLGWNSAEISGTNFMKGKPYTEENYIEKVKEAYPVSYEEALRLYPHGSDKEIELSATALASDRFIAYSAWKWFDLHRKNSSLPVYRYLYCKLRPPLSDKGAASTLADSISDNADKGLKEPEPVGAPHACEIEYCMGNLYLIKEYDWAKEDYKVSEIMQNYFANFIKTGNPNGGNLPEWPAAEATETTPKIMIIDVEPKVVDAKNESRYLFLDKDYNKN